MDGSTTENDTLPSGPTPASRTFPIERFGRPGLQEYTEILDRDHLVVGLWRRCHAQREAVSRLLARGNAQTSTTRKAAALDELMDYLRSGRSHG